MSKKIYPIVIIVDCVMCGKKFIKIVKNKQDFKIKTCSKKCHYILRNKNIRNPKERALKISIAHMGEKNIMWKGDDVGYRALHVWVKKRFTRTKLCQCCKKVPPIDLANKGIYDRELKNWEWLCRKCHMIKDGRLKCLIEKNKLKRLKDKECIQCKKNFHPKRLSAEFCSKNCHRAYANLHRIGTPYK